MIPGRVYYINANFECGCVWTKYPNGDNETSVSACPAHRCALIRGKHLVPDFAARKTLVEEDRSLAH